LSKWLKLPQGTVSEEEEKAQEEKEEKKEKPTDRERTKEKRGGRGGGEKENHAPDSIGRLSLRPVRRNECRNRSFATQFQNIYTLDVTRSRPRLSSFRDSQQQDRESSKQNETSQETTLCRLLVEAVTGKKNKANFEQNYQTFKKRLKDQPTEPELFRVEVGKTLNLVYSPWNKKLGRQQFSKLKLKPTKSKRHDIIRAVLQAQYAKSWQ
jgi:hypothetical protein